VDVEIYARTHELVMVLADSMLLEHHLDVVGHDPPLLLPRTYVPQDDDQVVGTGGKQFSVPDVFSTSNVAPMTTHITHLLAILEIVYLEIFQISFHHKKLFGQFGKEENMFNFMFMAAIVLHSRGELVFDLVYEFALTFTHTTFDDVVGELLPLQCLVVIDVDLFKELDDVQQHCIVIITLTHVFFINEG